MIVATKLSRQVMSGFKEAAPEQWSALVDELVAGIATSKLTAKYTLVACERACDVVDFDFDTAEMSFYCPLHRLLAAVLLGGPDDAMVVLSRCIRERTWEAIPSTATFTIVHLIEPPLQCFVLASKIRQGLLVRNGMGVHQAAFAIYHTDTLREITIDRDLAMLQLCVGGFASPAHFVRLLCTRFGLVGWFEPEFKSAADGLGGAGESAVALVQDMILLLLAVVQERGPGVGQTTTEAMIRREVVHILCEGRQSFSQIQKRLPKSMKDAATVESILHEVATRSDADGTFLITKEVACREFDSCYFHHSDAQRVKAIDNITYLRGNKVEFLPPPPPPTPEPAFVSLPRILLDEEVLKLIGTILTRAEDGWRDEAQLVTEKLDVSDGLAWACFHLIVLGLQDVSAAEFSEVLASTTLPKTPDRTILSAIERIRVSKRFGLDKGVPRFEPVAAWIMARLKTSTSRVVQAALIAVGVSIDGTASSAASADDSAREKRRAAAKARQAKIMAKFKSKQLAFTDKHGGSGDAAPEEITAPPSTALTDDGDLTCQTCLDDMQLDAIGASGVILFGHTQVSQVHVSPTHHGPQTTVCGHGMHVACFNDWRTSKIEEILLSP
jgi:E3 ubiquitin-protein ligase UBR1